MINIDFDVVFSLIKWLVITCIILLIVVIGLLLKIFL